MLNSTRKNLLQVLWIGFLIVLLSACSSNGLILSTVYNRADNTLAKNFYRYADFDSQQRKTIKAAIDQHHLWHRKQQLPAYIKLIREVHESLANNEPLTESKLAGWSAQFFQFREQLVQCNPLMYSAPLLQQLSDEQILQIAERFIEMDKKSRERRAKKTDQQRKADRDKRLIKNLKRVGLNLNSAQKEMIIAATEKNISLHEPWEIFWLEWKQDFLTLLRQRDQTQFPLELQQHLNEFWYMADQRHPEILKKNRDNWLQLLLKLGHSLSPDQQKSFLKFSDDLITSLEKISTSEPIANTDTTFTMPEECRVENLNA